MAKSSVRAQCAESNVIAFPAHACAPDPARAFMAAYYASCVARAEYELTAALCQQAQFLDNAAAIEVERSRHWRAFDRIVESVDLMAALPAQSRQQYDLKRRAIGPVWLKAEGERYDRLRAGLAADAARLGIKRR